MSDTFVSKTAPETLSAALCPAFNETKRVTGLGKGVSAVRAPRIDANAYRRTRGRALPKLSLSLSPEGARQSRTGGHDYVLSGF